MIIQMLLTVIYQVFSFMLSGVSIPKAPPELSVFFAQALEYMISGLSIASNFIDLDYLVVLFGIVIAVDVGLMFYRFFIWFIKKIPFLGIK